ncbi:MAG: TlpA family protein disulfide reductase [Hyphomicrobiaceae bacterium]|nr:TlpA family protein disulfide reductase [Hyphomicrobiaceae bacterium]
MSTDKQLSPAWKLIYAALAVVVGLTAIYVIVSANDNGRTPHNTAEPGTRGGKLNTGAMATFVFRDAPTAIPELRFNGPDGKPLTLASFKGRVVVLNLWATWCGPCKLEMPHLAKLKTALGDRDFAVVAVSLDRGSPDKPKKFLASANLAPLDLYHDPDAQIGFKLMAIGMPVTLVIDAEGREVGRLVGPAEWDSPEAIRLIRAQRRGARRD